jgi:hypothetical protein
VRSGAVATTGQAIVDTERSPQGDDLGLDHLDQWHVNLSKSASGRGWEDTDIRESERFLHVSAAGRVECRARQTDEHGRIQGMNASDRDAFNQ